MNEPQPNLNDTNPPRHDDVFARQLTQTSKRKKGRFWKRFWKGLGVFTLLGGTAAFGYFNYTPSGLQFKKDFQSQIMPAMQTAWDTHQDPDKIFEHASSDRVNILLIGRDVNWKIGKVYDPKTKTYRPYQVHDDSANARSDTMIVMSLDKTSHTIRMISFPRDSMVRIPGYGREKLNAAHAYGGPELLIKTLQSELGTTIHHYAVIKFDGFKKLIDQLGGVEVNVDGALKLDRRTGKLYRGNLDYDDNWGNLHVHLKPGVQTLNGDEAHGYVRFREDREGDPGRIRRQQQVMRALAKQMMHANMMQIPGLIGELRRQFKTDLTDNEIASAAYFARSLGDSTKLQPMTLFAAMNEDGSLTLNKPKNEKLLSYVLGSTFNPDHFLVHSPSTRRDDIGPTNNANPQALAVLRAAGVLGEGETEAPSSIIEAPVRDEGAPANALSASTRSSSGITPRRHRLRYAESDATHSVAVTPAAEEIRPRRKRRRKRASVESTSLTTASTRPTSHRNRKRSSTSSSESSASTRGESPVPVPEADTAPARHQSESSPVPQAE